MIPGLLKHDADAPAGPRSRPRRPAPAPAVTAAALARALAARGLTGIYTAAAARFGLVSVTAAVTAWTNGHQIWCTCAGQHHAWPAADIEAAAAAPGCPGPARRRSVNRPTLPGLTGIRMCHGMQS